MNRGFAACVVNYGPLPTNVRDIQKINASVLGIFGALDCGIPPDKVRAFEDCMNAAGKRRVGIEIYDGASQAFESPTNKSGYRPEAAADAWCHTLSVLQASEVIYICRSIRFLLAPNGNNYEARRNH